MSEFSRKSTSPMMRSKYSKLFINEIEKVSELDENPINESEETSEIAGQLALIRKRHDRTKESNLKKRLYYEKLKSEIDCASSSVSSSEQETKALISQIEALKVSLEQSQQRHEAELLNKRSYLHMLDRMKKDKIAMEIKANSLQVALKSTRNVLYTETDKFRKVRESQFQSKVMLQEIKQVLALDQKRKNERISQLEKNVKERQEIAMRREERQKRQAEISEAAANDDKDSQEAKIRENLLLNRMWYVFLRKKLESEILKGVDIEDAFQKIKAATGISDINDVVEKFLTRENSYAELVNAVTNAEGKLEQLKQYNLKAREKLNKAQFDDGNNRKIYSDIEGMEGKLSECYKEYAHIREKLQKSVISYDQVLNWGHKIFHTLEIDNNLDISPGSRISDSKNTIEEMFEIIFYKLKDLVEPIQGKNDETRLALENFAKRKTMDIVNELSNNEELAKVNRVKIDASFEKNNEAKDSGSEANHEKVEKD